MLKTTNKQRIFLSSPHMSGNEWRYIKEAFDTNWIAPLGPNIDLFEKQIADYVGVKEAVAVSSGTAAIHLALSILGVEKGDTVFCSSLTFVASANPIKYLGAEPVFIDSELETWNMCPDALERALMQCALERRLPKAIIVVNLYGQSAKMDEITALCNDFDIPMIEDAAESLGSMYKGKASGSFGNIGIFSFNGNKIITTSGGGMLVSNDTSLMKKARFLATQARDQAPHYQHSQLGYNYRMSNILAGVGRAQMEVLEDRVHARRKVFQRYYNELSNIPGISFMPELKDSISNRWLTALNINEQEAGVSITTLLKALTEENIEARPVWKPLHLQPLFKGNSYFTKVEGISISDQLFRIGICLPSGSNLLDEEQFKIIQCLKQNIPTKV